MCCTMTMPGAFVGNADRIAVKASVPPVDAPIATRRSEEPPEFLYRGCGGFTGSRDPTGMTRLRMRAWAAERTISMRTSADSCRKLRTPNCGLVIMPTAPSSKARKAVSVPFTAMLEQINVGMGSFAMIWRRKVRPSILGKSRSRRITSGRTRFIFCWAIMGSEATATEMSGSCDSTVASTWRTTAESSTARTLISVSALLAVRMFRAAPILPARIHGRGNALQRRAHAIQSFRVPQEQKTIASQVMDQAIDKTPPALGIEIDENVPAENQIELAQS